MKTDIKAAQSELAEWCVWQHDDVQAIGGRIVGLLGSAQIGTRPHPMIVAHLAEDVEKLRRAVGRICLRHCRHLTPPCAMDSTPKPPACLGARH